MGQVILYLWGNRQVFQQLWTPMLEKKKKKANGDGNFQCSEMGSAMHCCLVIVFQIYDLKSSSYSFYYCYYFIFFIYIIALLNYHKHFFLVLVQNLLPNVFFFFFFEKVLPNVGVMKVSVFELKYKLWHKLICKYHLNFFGFNKYLKLVSRVL